MKINDSFKNIFLCTSLSLAAIMLLFFPEIASSGAYNGIDICLKSLIPSLFPFLFLSLFLTESGISKIIFKIPSLLLSKISGLDKDLCDAFFLGMIGGYPSSAKNLSTLCKNKKLSAQNAKIMLCFCTNAGPSFLISAVGSKMFLSNSIGAILFISSVMSSFTLIFVYARKIKTEVNHIHKAKKTPLANSLVSSVKGSCGAMCTICAFVILFSVFSAFIPNTESEYSLFKGVIVGIFEVTSGVMITAGDISLLRVLVASALCGFGGFCVIFQICAIFSEAGLSIKGFIGSRILSAVLNLLYSFILLIFIPISTKQTFINNTPSASADVISAPLPAVFLLICCILFPIFITNRKKF